MSMNNTFGHPRYFKPNSGGVVRCKDGDNFYRKQGSQWVKYRGDPKSKRTHPWCGKVPAHAKGDVSKVAVGDCCEFNGSKYRLSKDKNFYRYNKPCNLSSSCGVMGSLKSMGSSAASASKSGSVSGARSQLSPAKWYLPYTTCSANGHSFYALKNKWNRYKSEDYVKRKGLTSHSACFPKEHGDKKYYLDSGKYYEPRANQTATGSWFKLSNPQPTFSKTVHTGKPGSRFPATIVMGTGSESKTDKKPSDEKVDEPLIKNEIDKLIAAFNNNKTQENWDAVKEYFNNNYRKLPKYNAAMIDGLKKEIKDPINQITADTKPTEHIGLGDDSDEDDDSIVLDEDDDDKPVYSGKNCYVSTKNKAGKYTYYDWDGITLYSADDFDKIKSNFPSKYRECSKEEESKNGLAMALTKGFQRKSL